MPSRFKKNFLSTLMITTGLLFINGCTDNELELETEFLASKDLNKTTRGYSAPVVLKVFQLSSLDKLHSANFIDIFLDASKALEGSLIQKQEIELSPRSTKQFRFEIAPEAGFLVLLAGFRKGERSNWRLILPITSDSPTEFSVGLKQHEILLLDKDGAGLFLEHEILNEAPSQASFDKYRGRGRR